MKLDDLLDTPLTAVRDDGFSARILLRLEQTRQRQLTLLWCMVAAALLPVLWFLPPELLRAPISTRLDVAIASPFFTTAAGCAVLFWAWRTRLLRF